MPIRNDVIPSFWRSIRCEGLDDDGRVPERRLTYRGALRCRGVKQSSEADEPIRLLDETGDVRWADPLSAERPEILVGRPTGDRASLSDVHRHFVLPNLGEQVAHRRDADTLETFADVSLQQLGGVAGQHHPNGVTDLQ